MDIIYFIEPNTIIAGPLNFAAILFSIVPDLKSQVEIGENIAIHTLYKVFCLKLQGLLTFIIATKNRQRKNGKNRKF